MALPMESEIDEDAEIEHLAPVVDAWLGNDITLRASVIHERLVAEHDFGGSYQRVKLYVAEARPRIAAELGLPGPLSGWTSARDLPAVPQQSFRDWWRERS